MARDETSRAPHGTFTKRRETAVKLSRNVTKSSHALKLSWNIAKGSETFLGVFHENLCFFLQNKGQ